MNEKKWYKLLKKKYKLSDDDMEEYIDSFNLINKGEIITPNILTDFINDEIENQSWSVEDSKEIINSINNKINGKNYQILDLTTYLSYIIPICHEYAINRIQIRELFDKLDTNKDNKITCDEFISILYRINKNFTPSEITLYKQQIRNSCQILDTNQDGYIYYNEFKIFMINKIMGLSR